MKLKDKSLKCLFEVDNFIGNILSQYEFNKNEYMDYQIEDFFRENLNEILSYDLWEDNNLQEVYNVYGEEISYHIEHGEIDNIFTAFEDAIYEYQVDYMNSKESREVIDKIVFFILSKILSKDLEFEIEIKPIENLLNYDWTFGKAYKEILLKFNKKSEIFSKLIKEYEENYE